jgi:hypothetical protein
VPTHERRHDANQFAPKEANVADEKSTTHLIFSQLPKHTDPPWELKRLLAGIGGPQAVIKRLPGGVEAIICLFVRSVGMSKEEQLATATPSKGLLICSAACMT